MPSNIEIKARAPDLGALRRKIERLDAAAFANVQVLDQEDIFFVVSSGRLKLRIIGPGQDVSRQDAAGRGAPAQGELILYHRPDIAGPKTSDYHIAPTTSPDALRVILEQILPTLAVVKKRRFLYLVGQTRVHLDQVEGLGDFVELEVVLREGQPAEEGVAIAADMMRKLDIGQEQLVEQAYVDLLAAKS